MIAGLRRKLRNAMLDLRYGAFLGGAVEESPFEDQGANASNNTDYGVMAQIFPGRIESGDVLVDVGCGRGRVLNFWLNSGLPNKIYGLEIDPVLAEKTRERLKGHTNVSILSGDATRLLPADATVIFLANPFVEPIMRRFEESASELERLRLVLYFAPLHVEIFRSAGRWDVEVFKLKEPPGVRFEPRHWHYAEIRPRRSS